MRLDELSNSDLQTIFAWTSSYCDINTFRGYGYLLLNMRAPKRGVLYHIEILSASGFLIGYPGLIKDAMDGVSAWLNYAAERAPIEIRFTAPSLSGDRAYFTVLSRLGTRSISLSV
jgi:hypothetical protein